MKCPKKQSYCSWGTVSDVVPMEFKCNLPPQVVICGIVIEKCNGCDKVLVSGYCDLYPDTSLKWRNRNCPSATHLKKKVDEQKKINPLKVSKKGVKK